MLYVNHKFQHERRRVLSFCGMLLYLNILFTKSLRQKRVSIEKRFVNSLSSIRFWNITWSPFSDASDHFPPGSSSCPLTNCRSFQGCPRALITSSLSLLFLVFIVYFYVGFHAWGQFWGPANRLENKHSSPDLGHKTYGASIPLFLSRHRSSFLEFPVFSRQLLICWEYWPLNITSLNIDIF